MHLLDTDTLTYLHEGHPRVVQRLRESNDPEVGITVVTRIEVLRGRFDFLLKASNSAELLRAQELLTRTEQLLTPLPVVPVDQGAAAVFDHLRQTKGLKKLGRADLLIASIALARQATLVTRNLRHFQRVPRLQVVNWVD
jgi:tRNA(fMet)-specific endonuclease VapC